MKRTRLKKVSDKQRKINIEIARIKADLYYKDPRCFFCRKIFTKDDLDSTHIVRRSYAQCLETEERNIILACRNHHNDFDSGTKEQRRALNNLDLVLDRMAELDYLYYVRFKDKKL
jgi:5-methylcytosine-specific restriction endonuclease McrA